MKFETKLIATVVTILLLISGWLTYQNLNTVEELM